ncbi:MAG: DUF1287 domain-containing protein, partial [Phenylobacterium sp.]|uniref:DUF1287 domain-containing protein n=1 Tax=Phenylobacterium sp. TaxID=1871053 RepID=UPI003BB725DC
LETYWARAGAQLWRAASPAAGGVSPHAPVAGDILTWRVGGALPHVGIVAAGGARPRVVHNIGAGAREEGLDAFAAHSPVGHYRWRPQPG